MLDNWEEVYEGNAYNREFGNIVLAVIKNHEGDNVNWFWEVWCSDCANRLMHDSARHKTPEQAGRAAEHWYTHTAHLEH